MDLHQNPDKAKAFTRRSFMHNGLVFASGAVTIPAFLNSAVASLPRPALGMSSMPGVPEDHVLVVVQLGGGNDGLNTVVPYQDDAYYRSRPTIAIPRNRVLSLESGDDVGLHPAMTGFKDLYDDGLLSIVQGVGYPNPNRSHFRSMDIWHTADTSGKGEGWIGKFFDNDCQGAPGQTTGQAPKDPSATAGIALGREAPLAMQGKAFAPVSFETPDLFRWIGRDIHDTLDQPYDDITHREPTSGSGESNTDFLLRTSLDAQVASKTIREAVSARPLVQFPASPLGRQLQMVSAMIRAGLDTRVYYVHHGSFDTHAGQGGENGRHANLLRQLADAMKAFYADLKAQGTDGRVLTVSFSEFGRRVAQNGSSGTDHGAAAPMFLFGPMVRPGVIGDKPSLTNLDNGDLKHSIDFRSVYAGVLEDWLKADSYKCLGKRFRPAKVVRA